jgi:glyoxylase-like metal-dependent hydrolase (beta-lactamase superfamily II)
MKIVVIVFLALLFAMGSSGVLYAATGEVFSAKIGEFEVVMLSEAQRESGLDILIGASKDDIAKFIPTGKYPSAVAAYLIKSPEGAVMVDTGFGREIERHLKSLGVSAGDVKTVLITHAHGDHIGGLLEAEKPAYPNAHVIVPKPDYEWSFQLREMLGKYDGKFEMITPGSLGSGGTEILKGVRAIAAYGHTPGHTMYLIESAGEKLLIWGDLAHAMAIQMPRPGVSVTYDSDPDEAAQVRKETLEFASRNKIPIAGMHIAYPGIGDIVADPENPGGYKFIPKSN